MTLPDADQLLGSALVADRYRRIVARIAGLYVAKGHAITPVDKRKASHAEYMRDWRAKRRAMGDAMDEA
jgi:hypothetical protein